jgi:GntR family transcriptional repressor for pyruvate dehydrogenase complex
LPPGRELAAYLGISILTLRIALKSLESTGYLITTRGRSGGSRVAELEALSRRWLDWMRDNADKVEDIWDFRETIETTIASFAARRRTDSELGAIEAALTASASDSHTAFLRWNDAFHDALAQASHSTHLTEAMHSVRAELFLPVGLLLRRRRVAELQDDHALILEAVRKREPEQAAESMRIHLMTTKSMVEAALRELRNDAS